MWAYCDTSALARRYVKEPGRPELMRLLARRRVVSSTLLTPELYSAFSRRAREGSLATVALPELFKRIAADSEHWTLVQVTAAVMRTAESLLELYPLRTLDAIHVASAQTFAAHVKPDMIFISADRRQQTAARSLGLIVRDLPA